MDDPEPTEEEEGEPSIENDNTEDSESLKASDEFEYYGTARASHKVRGFTFVPLQRARWGRPHRMCSVDECTRNSVASEKEEYVNDALCCVWGLVPTSAPVSSCSFLFLQ